MKQMGVCPHSVLAPGRNASLWLANSGRPRRCQGVHGNEAQMDETERLGSRGSSSLPPASSSSQQHIQSPCFVPGSVPYTGDTKTTG